VVSVAEVSAAATACRATSRPIAQVHKDLLSHNAEFIEHSAISPNGEWVALRCRRKVDVIDAHNGALHWTTDGMDAEIVSMAFSPNADQLFTAGVSLRAWCLHTGQLVREYAHAPAGSRCEIRLSPDGRRLFVSDSMQVFDVDSGAVICKLNTDTTSPAIFSSDSRYLTFGVWKTSQVQVFDAATGHLVHSVTLPKKELLAGTKTLNLNEAIWLMSQTAFCVALLNDARILVFGFGGAIVVLDMPEGRVVHLFAAEGGPIERTALSPDGSTVALANEYGELTLLHLATGQVNRLASPCSTSIKGLGYTDSGRHLMVGTATMVALCDAQAGSVVRYLRAPADFCSAYALSPNRLRLLTSSGANARFTNPEGANCSRDLRWHRHRINALAISAEGALVLSGSDDLTARITDACTGKHTRTLGGNGGRFHRELTLGYETSLYRLLHPEGPPPISNLVRRSGIGERIVRTICTAMLRALQWHDSSVMSAAFSPDGREALTGDLSGTVRTWDVASGKLLRRYRNQSQNVTPYHVGFSPDGTAVMAASSYRVTLWDRESGRELQSFGLRDSIHSAAFAGGPHRLLTCVEKRCLLWDVSGEEPVELQRFAPNQRGQVYCAAASDDGHRVVTGGANGQICVWDAANGALIQTLQADQTSLRFVGFGSSNDQIVAVGTDGSIRIWNRAEGNCQMLWWTPSGKSGTGIHCSGIWRTEPLETDSVDFHCTSLRPGSLHVHVPGADAITLPQLLATLPAPTRSLLRAPAASDRLGKAWSLKEALHAFGHSSMRHLAERIAAPQSTTS
jgi:WD40 repeat protein